jgi:hypothetical protein
VTDDLATSAVAPPFEPAATRRIRADPAALERFYLAHYDEVVRY